MSGSGLVGLVACGAIALVCLVLGAVLCTGRGWQVVAGLNTATPEERARYDVPKVCRATGKLMLVCAVLVAGVGALITLADRGVIAERGPAMIGGIAAICVALCAGCGALVWYTNKRCLKG